MTATLPKSVGEVGHAAPESEPAPSLLAGAKRVLTDGLSALFATDSLLRASVLLSFGISMVMGSWQGIVLPAYFTEMGRPELVGYVVCRHGRRPARGLARVHGVRPRHAPPHVAGRVAHRHGAGILVLGCFPDLPFLMGAAAVLGLFAGPASALMGFFAYDRVPEDRRGSAMGTLNALFLVVAPGGAFLGSVLVGILQLSGAGLALVGIWLAVTVLALVAPALRKL